MDRPPNPVEEATESVNSREQGLSDFDPSKSVRSESNVPNKPTKTLLKISQDMTRVLERLIAPKAPIDMMRRHGAEKFCNTLFKTHFIQTISNMRKHFRSLQ